MLIEVLKRLAGDTGLDEVQQRSTLINILNAGAKEIYDRLECNKIYWEVTLSVPPNKIVTLPNYIGELRGMRGATTEMTFPLHGISQPKYTRIDWSYKWRNWRDLGESATLQNPSIVAPLSVTWPIGENPVTLMISGQTNKAIRLEEKLILDAPTKFTSNMFGPSIYNIACLDQRNVDITISDRNGVLLATLYNNENQTRYKLVDISEAPWFGDVSNGNSLIDVQFKVPLNILSNDSDQFPASSNFDNAWYWMCMWIYYKPLQKKPQDFETYLPNSLAATKSAKNSGEQSIEKKISFGLNKYYNLTKCSIESYPGAITHIDTTNG